jgi:hypothetical protein
VGALAGALLARGLAALEAALLAGGSGLRNRRAGFRPGGLRARFKDRLERKLQMMVCSGEIALSTARSAVRKDWKSAYGTYVAPTLSRDVEIGEEERSSTDPVFRLAGRWSLACRVRKAFGNLSV